MTGAGNAGLPGLPSGDGRVTSEYEVPPHVDELATQLGLLYRMRELSMSRLGKHGADGLELAAYRCVFRIIEAGPMRTGELAEEVLSDPSTVSRHVAQLVDRGHLERRPDPDDRRAGLIAVTESGRRAAQRMRERRNERLAEAVGGWPDDERAELARLLSKLLDGYGARPAAGTGAADDKRPPGSGDR